MRVSCKLPVTRTACLTSVLPCSTVPGRCHAALGADYSLCVTPCVAYANDSELQVVLRLVWRFKCGHQVGACSPEQLAVTLPLVHTSLQAVAGSPVSLQAQHPASVPRRASSKALRVTVAELAVR